MSNQELPQTPAPEGVDFQPGPTIGGRPESRDPESQEWLAVDQVSPSDEELEALAKRLPAPADWYDKG